MSAAKTSGKGSKQGAGAAGGAGDRIGRGTRWTEEQVQLLMDAVRDSSTAKEAFEGVAKQLGKSTGTVQQKYYNLQRKAGGGRGRRSAAGARSAGSASTPPAARRGRGAAGAGLPGANDLRSLTVDELVGLATRVKDEVDRRRKELEEASKRLAG